MPIPGAGSRGYWGKFVSIAHLYNLLCRTLSSRPFTPPISTPSPPTPFVCIFPRAPQSVSFKPVDQGPLHDPKK